MTESGGLDTNFEEDCVVIPLDNDLPKHDVIVASLKHDDIADFKRQESSSSISARIGSLFDNFTMFRKGKKIM